MTTLHATTHAARQAGNHAQRQVAPWVEKLARVGYAAKGFTYCLIGLLALLAAFGNGGQTGGSRDALSYLENTAGTAGTVLLWLVAIGIAGYAIWQFFRAALDPENEGDDAKGIAKRVFFAISGIIHGVLAVWVFTHLLSGDGGSGGGGSGGTQDMVGRVLDWGMAGRLLVAAAGLGIGGFGIGQIIKAWKIDLSDQLSLANMSEPMRQTTIRAGRAGLAARGIVFTLIGFFLLMAAWQYDASESGGLGETLSWLGGFGPWVLGIIALGLVCYGIYMFIKARYRRINVAT